MIAALMLSMTIVGVLAVAAAWVTERACVGIGVARRWSWLAAMIFMAAAPALPGSLMSRAEVVLQSPGAGATPTDAVVRGPLVDRNAGRATPATRIMAFAIRTQRFDRALIAAWLFSSGVLLLLAGAGMRTLLTARRGWLRWHRERFSMPTTWVSDDVGPAAFGAGRGEIVLPRWAMTLPLPDRRLLLQHERAHVHARDPMLLAVGQALVIALPWLVPLRWAFRRLQRAVEHDCDRRVLRRPFMVRRYADLLLHVAERGLVAPPWAQRVLASASGTVATTALLSAEPDLEARLRALVRPCVTWRSRTMAVASAGVASALTALSCHVPLPRAASLDRLAVRHIVQGPLLGRAVRDPVWASRTSRHAGSAGAERSVDDSVWFARTDSLVIDAIERTRPALLALADTESPFVSVTITLDNAIVAHSVRPRLSRERGGDWMDAARREGAMVAAGVPMSREDERDFRAWMDAVANYPHETLDSLGVSHLLVGERALTVLWVRVKHGVRG